MIVMTIGTIIIGTKIVSINQVLIATRTNPVVRITQNAISDTVFNVQSLWRHCLQNTSPIVFHCRGVSFSSLLVTRCKITRYSLQNLLVTRCKILLLLVIEVARCKKSLVTHCRNWSLQKITRDLLQNSLVTRCRSCSLQKISCYSLQNLLVTPCRSCSLQKVTRHKQKN